MKKKYIFIITILAMAFIFFISYKLTFNKISKDNISNIKENDTIVDIYKKLEHK